MLLCHLHILQPTSWLHLGFTSPPGDKHSTRRHIHHSPQAGNKGDDTVLGGDLNNEIVVGARRQCKHASYYALTFDAHTPCITSSSTSPCCCCATYTYSNRFLGFVLVCSSPPGDTHSTRRHIHHSPQAGGKGDDTLYGGDGKNFKLFGARRQCKHASYYVLTFDAHTPY